MSRARVRRFRWAAFRQGYRRGALLGFSFGVQAALLGVTLFRACS